MNALAAGYPTDGEAHSAITVRHGLLCQDDPAAPPQDPAVEIEAVQSSNSAQITDLVQLFIPNYG
jgi:hypothetical protein